jgi:hypothetical protein
LSPIISLARFTNFTHGSRDVATGKVVPEWADRLVWIVAYLDVPADQLPQTGPPGAGPPSGAGVYLRVVDATTGIDLEEFSASRIAMSPAALGA